MLKDELGLPDTVLGRAQDQCTIVHTCSNYYVLDTNNPIILEEMNIKIFFF